MQQSTVKKMWKWFFVLHLVFLGAFIFFDEYGFAILALVIYALPAIFSFVLFTYFNERHKKWAIVFLFPVIIELLYFFNELLIITFKMFD